MKIIRIDKKSFSISILFHNMKNTDKFYHSIHILDKINNDLEKRYVYYIEISQRFVKVTID